MGCFKSKGADEKQQVKLFDFQNELVKQENVLYKDIDQLFHEFDKNNDLELDCDEFQTALDTYLSRNKENLDLYTRVYAFRSQVIFNRNKKFRKEEFIILKHQSLILP